jgi:hypothetical protein
VTLELLPAVDVADGQAVRLVQGEAGSETGYGDPLEAALQWQRDGAEWVHLVDLDAAFGRGSNREQLAAVVGALDVKVELSGGIRDDASLAAALATGCARVNLGRPPSSSRPGAPGPSPSTATASRWAWTCAARRWPPAAGRRRAATSGRSSTGSTARGVRATSSPTSAATAR